MTAERVAPTEFATKVISSRTVGPQTVVLHLAPESAAALQGSMAGQFVMVRGEWGRDPLLPRAFSLLNVFADGTCELLVKAVGRATRRLVEISAGETLYLLGPLGRSFPEPAAMQPLYLVAGGVGLAPLLWVAQTVSSRVKTALFYGARTPQDWVLGDEIAKSGCEVFLTAESGDLATLPKWAAQAQVAQGRVTDVLEAQLRNRPDVVVYTCGPNAMMRAVSQMAQQHHVQCFVSVEGEMACGIGACLGCAIPKNLASDDKSKPFAYACVDGPVFDASKIVLP